MHIDEHSILEFNNYHFVVRNLTASTMDEAMRYYSAFPLIREAVRKVTNLLGTDFPSLFAGDSSALNREMCRDELSQEQRRFDLGRLITSMEYFTIQGDQLTLVTSEQRFARETISRPPLKSLVSHIKRLVTAIVPGEVIPHDGEPEAMKHWAAPEAGCPSGIPASLLKCRRCGECCRSFSVVVTPDDIACMAKSLALTRADLRAQYLAPEPYTWSEHNALLKTVLPPGRGAKSRTQQCIFLKREEANSCSCGIYPARPSACRRYLPNLGLCRRSP
jgi:Fe-S-cluster containining protein